MPLYMTLLSWPQMGHDFRHPSLIIISSGGEGSWSVTQSVSSFPFRNARPTKVFEGSIRSSICSSHRLEITWRRDARRSAFAQVVVDDAAPRTKTGQLWAYARDDRPWGGAEPPAVAYVYAPDRKAERPIAHLAGFSGVLQVDGYGGYRPLAEKGQVQLAFCWAHVRRRFYELAAAGPAPIASEALDRIKALHAVEAEIRGLEPDARRTARQHRSLPVIQALEPWLRAKLTTVSQKTKLAEAIRYALSRWADPVPRRRPRRARQQRRRAFHPPPGAQPQEQPLRRLRRRRRALGDPRLAHRDRQAQRRRSPGLHRQHHHPHRRRTPAERHRSVAALALSGHRRSGRLTHDSASQRGSRRVEAHEVGLALGVVGPGARGLD